MNPLLHWLTSPEWTHVVGALLHSLWQGAILAVVLALILRRLANPVVRYRCALGALGLLLIANLITWAVLNAPQPTAPVASPAPTLTAPAPTDANALQPNATDKIIAIAELTQPQTKINWTAWIALFWMFGMLLMLIRASIKVAGAEKLRRSCRPLADNHIAALVAEACRAVQLTRKIRVAVTDKLTSPAVVGVLVSTLILPLSLFTTLTPTQIQFILLHELAHIRRGDYLANLFQLFAESLWFFNPAVWWISHQIRREREACCDALAIELSGAPADYALTLVHVAENILQPAPAAASAFGDDGREPSSLADRVQRLLVPGYRPALRLTWRAMLTALFVGGGLLFLSALGARNTVGAILTSNQSNNSSVAQEQVTAASPEVLNDVATNHTAIIPALIESLGYDLATAASFVPPAITGTGQTLAGTLPLPNFRVRQFNNYVERINDKVPVLGDLPLIGKLFTSESSAARHPWFNSGGSSHWTVERQNQINQHSSRDGSTLSLDPNRPTQTFFYRAGNGQAVPASQAQPIPNPNRESLNTLTNHGITAQIAVSTGERNDSDFTRSTNWTIDQSPAANRQLTQQFFWYRTNETHPALTNHQPIEISGDPVFADTSAGFVSVTNNGRVRFNNQRLKADFISLNRNTGDVIARGNVRLEGTNGIYSGEELNWQTWSNIISGRHLKFFRLLDHTNNSINQPTTDGETTQLTTRTFQVVPNLIAEAIEAKLPQFRPVTATNVAEGLRALLQTSGADLTPPKSLFYNDRAGGLFVRATKEDLDAIESLLQVIGRQPAQVNIKAVFVELPIGKKLPKQLTELLEPIIGTGKTNFTGILTKSQFNALLRALESNSSVQIQASPQVSTLSGRQAQLQIAEVRTIVSGIKAVVSGGATNLVYESQAMPFGPVLDVLPTVSQDGYTVQMTLTPTFTEFLGYEHPKNLKITMPSEQATFPLPIIRTRQITTSASVWDGQTIVLGNFSDRILPTATNLKSAQQTSVKPQSKQMLVFVTPTIIDSTGNPANKDLGLPSRLNAR